MSMVRKLAVMAAFALALPSVAGIRFTAETRSEGKTETKVSAIVSGSRAKVTFLQGGTGVAAAGDYLLSPDAGRTLYMVSPATHTYTRYDVSSMLSGLGIMVHDIRGLMKVTFESPKIEKIAETDGGRIAGLPTRHYTYRTSYTVSMQSPNVHKVTTTIEEDIWTTSQVTDSALGVWLKKDQPATGDEELDRMIRGEMDKVQGFPVKRVTVTHTLDSKGVEHIARSEMEVTALEQVSVPDLDFAIPGDYREVRPVRPGEEE